MSKPLKELFLGAYLLRQAGVEADPVFIEMARRLGKLDEIVTEREQDVGGYIHFSVLRRGLDGGDA